MRDVHVYRSSSPSPQVDLLREMLKNTVNELLKTNGWLWSVPQDDPTGHLAAGAFGSVVPSDTADRIIKRCKLSNERISSLANAAREVHVLARMPWFDTTYFPRFFRVHLSDDVLSLEFERADCDAFDYVQTLHERRHGIAIPIQRFELHIQNALHFMHWSEFYHCDVKLENVLVFGPQTDTPQYKLTDFGSAHWGPSADLMAQKSYGTTGYIPLPNVFKRLRPETVGPVRDWWAFGVSLYCFAAFAMPPFTTLTPMLPPWGDHITTMKQTYPHITYCEAYLTPFARFM